ncbi:MAG: hypothetical protein ACREJO_01750 [Phycisphaerales bacterium]
MFTLPTSPTPTDRSKLVTSIGHVSIVIVFLVIVAAMGLTAAPVAPDTEEAAAPTVRRESKLRARPIPTATWAPATPAVGDSAACAPTPADPRQLVCRSFSLLQLEPLSEFDLTAPATSSCGRTITLWTY